MKISKKFILLVSIPVCLLLVFLAGAALRSAGKSQDHLIQTFVDRAREENTAQQEHLRELTQAKAGLLAQSMAETAVTSWERWQSAQIGAWMCSSRMTLPLLRARP